MICHRDRGTNMGRPLDRVHPQGTDREFCFLIVVSLHHMFAVAEGIVDVLCIE